MSSKRKYLLAMSLSMVIFSVLLICNWIVNPEAALPLSFAAKLNHVKVVCDKNAKVAPDRMDVHRTLYDAAQIIRSTTEIKSRNAMAAALVDAVANIDFYNVDLTNSPTVAYARYAEMVEWTSYYLHGEDRAVAVDSKYRFKLLMLGWKRLKDRLEHVDEIVETWFRQIPNCPPDRTLSAEYASTFSEKERKCHEKNYSVYRQKQLKWAHEKVYGDLRRSLDRLEEKMEKGVLKMAVKDLFSPGEFDKAVKQFSENIGRVPKCSE